MDDIEKLKGMLAELGKSKAVFARQTQEFENLQLEISRLQQRADVDPQARKKLERLGEYMSREGDDSQCRLVEKMAKTEVSLKKVGEQLHSLSALQQDASEKEMPVVKSNMLKKFNKNFA